MTPRAQLLDKVMAYAAEHGIADKSLRTIASGAHTSHRMLLYHFGSREGLLAEIVAQVEQQQRATMLALARSAGSPGELMLDLWERVSSPQLRPAVQLFFQVFALAIGGAPGTQALLDGLTEPWLDDAGLAAGMLDVGADPRALRLGVAVTRGLLLDLLAGADPAAVDASYRLFAELAGPAIPEPSR